MNFDHNLKEIISKGNFSDQNVGAWDNFSEIGKIFPLIWQFGRFLKGFRHVNSKISKKVLFVKTTYTESKPENSARHESLVAKSRTTGEFLLNFEHKINFILKILNLRPGRSVKNWPISDAYFLKR